MLDVHVHTSSDSLDAAVGALVSAIRGCSVSYGPPKSLTNGHSASGSLVVLAADLSDPSSTDRLRENLASLGAPSRSPAILLLADHLGSQSPWPEEYQSWLSVGVTEIIERPLDLKRVRSWIESLAIRNWSNNAVSAMRTSSACATPNRIMKQIKKVARLDVNVLLTGETGVGKTYWAQQIHQHSDRAAAPFVVVNCANFTADLAESQLFGHVRGAFTGADENRKGQLDFAADGTIFLDELDSLPLTVQGKLLHVVEERLFRPLGGIQTQPFRARILSATNQEPQQLVASPAFRSDLYYRMNGYQINIPPLRQRAEEIPPLVELFAQQFCKRVGSDPVRFSEEALRRLARHDWPGNLRELRNAVEHGVIESEQGVVAETHLSPAVLAATECSPRTEARGLRIDAAANVGTPNDPGNPAVREFVEALQRNDFNRSQTARDLGVSRMTVYNIMKRLGVQ